jgi:hypothetical protein
LENAFAAEALVEEKVPVVGKDVFGFGRRRTTRRMVCIAQRIHEVQLQPPDLQYNVRGRLLVSCQAHNSADATSGAAVGIGRMGESPSLRMFSSSSSSEFWDTWRDRPCSTTERRTRLLPGTAIEAILLLFERLINGIYAIKTYILLKR